MHLYAMSIFFLNLKLIYKIISQYVQDIDDLTHISKIIIYIL